jgi:hypothetical protein
MQRTPRQWIVLGLGLGALLAAVLLLAIPSSPDCGSVIRPGPGTVLSDEHGFFSNFGCNGAQNNAVRLALLLALAGGGVLAMSARVADRSSGGPSTPL